MSVQVDEEILGNLVNELAEKHVGTTGKTSKFKTTGGSYININVAREGQSVDATALYNDMLECLKSKTGGTRTAPYTAASDSGDSYWGGNYVEIDQTSQHLWLYKNGTCILDCGVVSGNVANNTRTPNGCFTIFAMNKDRYLQGSNVNGTRYKTWVSYFMPFSGGCGIHDATWRSSFGGDQYLYNGSHGCVGVSLSNARKIYENVNVGFHVVAVDYDPAFLNEERFPQAERIMLHGGNFDELANMPARPEDYVCVLTRGHMFDPESCIWALQNGVHYVGMMGCAGKNSTVHDLVINAGISEADWDRVKRPIGLKFGAKTPAELAIAIVAELVDVRYKQRYSDEARNRHEKSLGRE